MSTQAKYPTIASTPTEREIVVTRMVDAPRELVFAVHTQPKHLQRWMLGPDGWSMPECSVDLRPGGEWRHVWQREDGSRLVMHGIYQEIDPPERFSATESWGPEWPETLNTVILTEEESGKTLITTRILYPSAAARDAAYKTGMMSGMEQSFERLDSYLAAQ